MDNSIAYLVTYFCIYLTGLNWMLESIWRLILFFNLKDLRVLVFYIFDGSFHFLKGSTATWTESTELSKELVIRGHSITMWTRWGGWGRGSENFCVDKTFLTPSLTPSSCPRSYWMAPYDKFFTQFRRFLFVLPLHVQILEGNFSVFVQNSLYNQSVIWSCLALF